MILYIDHQVPRPDEDAGSLRASALLRILRTLGHKVTLSADGRPPRPDHERRLADLEVAMVPRRELAERLADASLRPDLVIVARVDIALAAMPIIRAHVPEVP